MKTTTVKRWRSTGGIGGGVLLVLCGLLALAARVSWAATFTVLNTNDAGPGSLRQSIESANAAAGADLILFRIPATDPNFAGGVFTIRPQSPLPALAGPTTIDGASQSAFTGNTNAAGPEVVLNGSLAGASANGLTAAAASCVIRGMTISGFSGRGVVLDAGSNRVEGCYIGTNAAGTAAVANGAGGVQIWSANNLIGGTTAAARNVISGNGAAGIDIFTSGVGNFIRGNYIGTNAAGTAAVPNGGSGVLVQHTGGNTIGGTVAGSRNVISGNMHTGVSVEDAFAIVQGNYIGTNAAGTAAVPNSTGVDVANGAIDIGGASTAARNVISGNAGEGILITRGSDGVVLGNYIGLTAAGSAALPNSGPGLLLYESFGSVIGGSTAAARNIISGNGGDGIIMLGESANNRVQGNYIGTNSAGTAVLGNTGSGIVISDFSWNNQVGGAVTGAGNLISGNGADGIRVSGAGSDLQLIQGNFIGTRADGGARLANAGHGVVIADGSTINLVGGATAAARNVVSGNQGHGVLLEGEGTRWNLVRGNHVGISAGGTAPISNGQNGISLDSATDNLVGGTVTGARNVISGNTGYGILIQGFVDGNNQVQGNYVGANAAGTGAVPNGSQGVAVHDSRFNLIGGTVVGARNVISGNNNDGVFIGGDNSADNRVQGNYIGVNAAGTGKLANIGTGVVVHERSAVIGGGAPGARNIISGNTEVGILLHRSGSEVLGNYIGTNAAGAAAVPNHGGGVRLLETDFADIGGAAAGARNVISGNLGDGVNLDMSTVNCRIQGNLIGLNAAGTGALANSGDGVEINGECDGNLVGGAGAGAGNVISGNLGSGIVMSGPISSPGNQIHGNLIGTNAAGTVGVANRRHGVELDGEIHQTAIGGVEPGEGNVIAFNFLDGVHLTGSDPAGTAILGNAIYNNTRLGINLRPAGEATHLPTPNDSGDGDTGPNRLQNHPVLSQAQVLPSRDLTFLRGSLHSQPNRTYRLEFFRNPAADPSGFGEGQALVGSTTVATDGFGGAAFSLTLFGSASGFFTATATDLATSETSEFSPVRQSQTITSPTMGAVRAAAATRIVAGRVTGQSGAGLAGVRVVLVNPGAAESLLSPDWDPVRLAVRRTDQNGCYSFSGVSGGRHTLLVHSPGIVFSPKMLTVDAGTPAAAQANFTAADVDHVAPVLSVIELHPARAGALLVGRVDDSGAGVQGVLVRIRTEDQGRGARRWRYYNWRSGVWEARSTRPPTKRAILDRAGNRFSLELPLPAVQKAVIEVQAYDWAGRASGVREIPY